MTNKPFFTLAFIGLVFLAGCITSRSPVTPSREMKSGKNMLAAKEAILLGILKQYPQYFDTLLKNNQQWRIKIIYTQINRKANNKPVFTNYYFNYSTDQYFYPASTVKMPTAVLALQRLNELKIHGLDKNATMITESAWDGQTSVYNDPDAEDGRPSIANYIKKIFLVSDNNAFNRLYEFLGQEYINNSLHKMGFDSTQIIHRLNISLTEDQNRHSNPVSFYDLSGKMLYRKPLTESKMVYQSRYNLLGKGYYKDDKLISAPFDFSKKNRIFLADLHSILETILFPEAFPRSMRFKLNKEDYQFLYRYMSMKPHEAVFPQYDSTFNDAYSKLLLYGGKGSLDSGIRIFNKEGDAYGFLTDVAYIVDFKNNIEFLVSASILCNSDGIVNDDRYDYENVGYPFLRNLGRALYDFELKRKRGHIPDLLRFNMIYSR